MKDVERKEKRKIKGGKVVAEKGEEVWKGVKNGQQVKREK